MLYQGMNNLKTQNEVMKIWTPDIELDEQLYGLEKFITSQGCSLKRIWPPL